MIFMSFIKVILTPISALFSILPTISVDFTFLEDYKSLLVTIFGLVGYFLPIAAIFPIIIANIFIDLFTIAMSILVRIKSFIPSMPGG